MTKNVFAGKWEIAAENGMNKSIARFPDVCMSPPSPPAGPIPIPYPDTSFSNNLKSASTTVKIGGKGAALAQKSYYKEPVLGDEAATRTFGANVISHQITGKTYFQAWCMDVKFEDKNVCRHLDITSSNHGSQPVITPPLPTMETMTMADVQTKLNQGKCPCCDGPLHEWQKDPNNNNQPYAPMTSSDFWQNRIDRMPVATPAQRALRGQRQVAAGKLKQAQRQSREAQAAGRPGCPNVHQNETDGCAIHFDIPEGTVYPDGQTVAQKCDAEFTYEVKAVTRSLWARANRRKVPPGTTLDHITPKQAGGCNSPNNTVPRNYVQGTSCKEVEANQTILEQGYTAVSDEIKDDEWTFRDLSLGFHLRNDDILRYDPEALLRTGREWNIVAALNILGRSGNFSQLDRLTPVLAATDDAQIWDAGINMLGFSGSWPQIVRWYDLFMQRPDAPGVKYYMAFLLGASCDRRAINVLLNLYSRSSDSEEARNHVIRELSCLLEARNNSIFLARNADPPFADLVSLIRPAVEAQASKESNSIFEGAILDIPSLAEKMRNELFQEEVARGRLLRGRLVFEASTGIDCTPMFNEIGNLNRLAAIAILDEFLDTDPGTRFLPGRRYFFGHPIPL